MGRKVHGDESQTERIQQGQFQALFIQHEISDPVGAVDS